VAVLAGLVALTGCAPKMRGVPADYTPMASIEGLELDENQRPALIWVRPGAASFASYERFIIDPARIDYRDPDMAELSSENVAQLQDRFQDALVEQLQDGGYEVGTKSQAGTMRISFTISGLKARRSGGAINVGAMAAGGAVGLPVIFVLSVGEVTIEGVFRDALTNRIEAVAVDRTAGSKVLNKSPWSTWSDVEETFDIWARGIREAIDEAHGR
jgi:hypothetical protein